jgi:spermidine synthase
VYPDGWALLANNSLETPVLGLVARADHRRFVLGAVRERLRTATFAPSPADYGIEDEYALLGSFIAGPDALRRFAAGSVLNTDDRPIVAYRAPRVTYAPDSLPRARLEALLAAVQIEPAELVDAPRDFETRLAGYFAARNRFIAAGANVTPSSDVREMLAQVREPLLGVLRVSPDFRPAYDPLLMMSTALAHSDVNAARELLGELARAQPERDDARRVLATLITQPSPERHLVK